MEGRHIPILLGSFNLIVLRLTSINRVFFTTDISVVSNASSTSPFDEPDVTLQCKPVNLD